MGWTADRDLPEALALFLLSSRGLDSIKIGVRGKFVFTTQTTLKMYPNAIKKYKKTA